MEYGNAIVSHIPDDAKVPSVELIDQMNRVLKRNYDVTKEHVPNLGPAEYLSRDVREHLVPRLDAAGEPVMLWDDETEEWVADLVWDGHSYDLFRYWHAFTEEQNATTG